MAMLGFYGGTFDPIHQGHLQSVLYVQQYCQLDRLELIPCHLPPHRTHPGVSSEHRAEMVRLAIAPYPQLALNLLELAKNSPSYTVETMELLRAQYPNDTLLFVIGMDSLTQFHRWFRYRDILKLCHLLVCQRPGYQPESIETKALLAEHQLAAVSDLHSNTQGGILILPNPMLDVSATAIRKSLQQSANIQSHPQQSHRLQIEAVQAYILEHQLYQV
ncbi:nicotinate-nucleotide adenylyltransferase [Rheinheimera riviphila]|uniref:Probable nicotinate-nucleotide adenylyltransferase n=1 Tax=Rheinheimera riviphila TaxID=1834037 RepID=A0A437QS45_9GAMM|nr:nicotinate-nucleotide adenylyltransferase [Rheinheimera riviphila]RVU37336.1 nicotinate-nucleotide adenylyltransferase [Rheinheimera riviphila]